MSSTTLRFGHTDGVSSLRYVPSDGRIVTAGADGDIRVYADIDDDDSKSHLVGDSALALAISPQGGKAYVSASSTNCVRAYCLETGASDALVARFTADVTCLDCHDLHVAAGSADMTLKVGFVFVQVSACDSSSFCLLSI